MEYFLWGAKEASWDLDVIFLKYEGHSAMNQSRRLFFYLLPNTGEESPLSAVPPMSARAAIDSRGEIQTSRRGDVSGPPAVHSQPSLSLAGHSRGRGWAPRVRLPSSCQHSGQLQAVTPNPKATRYSSPPPLQTHHTTGWDVQVHGCVLLRGSIS